MDKKDNKKLIGVRKALKSKKPDFIQQDYHKKRRLSLKWKRPTGIQSKMRHQFKGYGRRVKQGWRSPVEVRGTHSTGYFTVLVTNLAQMDSIPKDFGIIIGASVGMKKKLDIIAKAEKLKLPVLNIKVEEYKKKADTIKTQKQEEIKTREDRKKKNLESAVKKSEKKQKAESKSENKADENATDKELSVDEKKAEEKKEKDDVLIHKE